MRFELVENARDFWKWASVQLHIAATAIAAAFILSPEMPAEIRDLLPDWLAPYAVAAWLVIGILARVVQFGEAAAGEGESNG